MSDSIQLDMSFITDISRKLDEFDPSKFPALVIVRGDFLQSQTRVALQQTLDGVVRENLSQSGVAPMVIRPYREGDIVLDQSISMTELKNNAGGRRLLVAEQKRSTDFDPNQRGVMSVTWRGQMISRAGHGTFVLAKEFTGANGESYDIMMSVLKHKPSVYAAPRNG